MNKLESDILNRLLHEPFTNKRALAEVSGDSLEIVNHELENLMNEGYIDKSIHLTDKALSEFEQKTTACYYLGCRGWYANGAHQYRNA